MIISLRVKTAESALTNINIAFISCQNCHKLNIIYLFHNEAVQYSRGQQAPENNYLPRAPWKMNAAMDNITNVLLSVGIWPFYSTIKYSFS